MRIHPPLNFKPGDTWQIQGNLAYATGLPFDLSPGCFLEWAIEDSTGHTILAAQLGNGITVLDAAAGQCLISIGASQSQNVPVGGYVDQLRAIDHTGYASTQWQGPINVWQSFFSP